MIEKLRPMVSIRTGPCRPPEQKALLRAVMGEGRAFRK